MNLVCLALGHAVEVHQVFQPVGAHVRCSRCESAWLMDRVTARPEWALEPPPRWSEAESMIRAMGFTIR